MNGIVIDINADLGESAVRLANGADFELMRHTTSANVACGGHAGDAETMKRTIEFAKELGVAVGAHPSYPDRVNFGRVTMSMNANDLETAVRRQIEELARVARGLGVELRQVKPHGALYYAASQDREVARAVGRAAQAIHPRLVMIGQAESASLEVWREMGLRCAGEAFADRTYERDGALRSRTLAGAVLEEPARAARQAVDIAMRHVVATADGTEAPLAAETICIHSDTRNAAVIARAVREGLKAAGVEVQALEYFRG